MLKLGWWTWIMWMCGLVLVACRAPVVVEDAPSCMRHTRWVDRVEPDTGLAVIVGRGEALLPAEMLGARAREGEALDDPECSAKVRAYIARVRARARAGDGAGGLRL